MRLMMSWTVYCFDMVRKSKGDFVLKDQSPCSKPQRADVGTLLSFSIASIWVSKAVLLPALKRPSYSGVNEDANPV